MRGQRGASDERSGGRSGRARVWATRVRAARLRARGAGVVRRAASPLLAGLALSSALATGCVTEEVRLEHAPSAFAGFDGPAVIGEELVLDGTASEDPDGDALLFSWRLELKPDGALAAIHRPDAPVTALVPDRAGTYVVSLVVTDGSAQSRDLATFHAVEAPEVLGPSPLVLSPQACNADLADLERAPCGRPGGQLGLTPVLPADAAGRELRVEWTWFRTPPGVSSEDLPLEGSDPLGEVRFTPARPGEYWISARLVSGTGASAPALASFAVFDAGPPASERPVPRIEGPSRAAKLDRLLFDATRSTVPPPGPGATVVRRWGHLIDPARGSDSLADLATGCPTDQCRVMFPTSTGVYVITHEIEVGGVRGATGLFALEVR